MNWTINTQVLVESITNQFTIEEKLHTHQWIMIMEWWDKDMEVNVLMQHDNKLIRMESDQFMEDRSEFNFEHVPNQEPLLV